MIDYLAPTVQERMSLEQIEAWVDESKHFPATTFLPNKAQAEAAKAIGNLTPDKRIYLITSGNGTGKTTIAANIVINLVWGNVNIYNEITDVETGEEYTGFFDYPLFNNWPKKWPKKIWYVSNKHSLESIISEFKRWLPNDGSWKSRKNGKNFEQEFVLPNGWQFYFRTVDEEVSTFESANVGFIIFDEPPPITIYRACVSRLRSGGLMMIPATPLFGAGWFVDEIIDRIAVDGDKWHQTVPVWENVIEKAGHWDLGMFGVHPKGNLRQQNVEFTLRNYDPDEREAREWGKFKYLSGLVYKLYQRDLHFKPLPHIITPKNYEYRFIMDPHDRRPPACAWVRLDSFNRRTVIREWPSIKDQQYGGKMFHKIKDAGNFTIRDFVQFWMEIEQQLGIPPNQITDIIDPNFGKKKSRVTGLMVYEEYMVASHDLQQEGLAHRTYGFVTDAIDDLATGHKQVKQLLKPTPNNDLLLLIGDECHNMDYGFRNYAYDERSAKEEEKHGVLDGKVKEYAKDFPDLIRYDAMVPWEFSLFRTNLDPYERQDYDEEPDGYTVDRPEGAEGV